MIDSRSNLPIEKKFSNTISPIIDEVFRDFDKRGWTRPTLILIGYKVVEPLRKEKAITKMSLNADYCTYAEGSLFGTKVMFSENIGIDPNDIIVMNSIGQTQLITVHN